MEQKVAVNCRYGSKCTAYAPMFEVISAQAPDLPFPQLLKKKKAKLSLKRRKKTTS